MYGLIDQVVSSGSNFAALLLVARVSDPQSFGLFSIGWATLVLGTVVTRSVFGIPVSTDLHSLDEGAARGFLSRSYAGALLVAGGVSSVFVGAFAVGSVLDHESRWLALIFAASAPVVLTQDLARFVCLASRRPLAALWSDTVWTLMLLSTFALIASGWWKPGPPEVMVVWLLGALLASVAVAPVIVPPSFRGLLSWVRQDVRRRQLFGDSLLSAVTPVVSGLLVATLASATVLGAVRAAATVLSPLNVAISAVGFAVLPEASRRSPRRALVMLARVSATITVLALLWIGCLTLPGLGIGQFLLGELWVEARPLVGLVGAEYVALAVVVGAVTFLRAHGGIRAQLQVRYVYTSLHLLLVGTAAAFFVSAPPVAAAAAAAAFVFAVLGWTAALRRLGALSET